MNKKIKKTDNKMSEKKEMSILLGVFIWVILLDFLIILTMDPFLSGYDFLLRVDFTTIDKIKMAISVLLVFIVMPVIAGWILSNLLKVKPWTMGEQLLWFMVVWIFMIWALLWSSQMVINHGDMNKYNVIKYEKNNINDIKNKDLYNQDLLLNKPDNLEKIKDKTYLYKSELFFNDWFILEQKTIDKFNILVETNNRNQNNIVNKYYVKLDTEYKMSELINKTEAEKKILFDKLLEEKEYKIKEINDYILIQQSNEK